MSLKEDNVEKRRNCLLRGFATHPDIYNWGDEDNSVHSQLSHLAFIHFNDCRQIQLPSLSYDPKLPENLSGLTGDFDKGEMEYLALCILHKMLFPKTNFVVLSHQISFDFTRMSNGLYLIFF
jgi:hypothetical protein